MDCALVICRSPAGIRALREVRSSLPLVIASDDARVQAAVRSLPLVRDVCFIEQTESFYHAVDEVTRLLGLIDEGLAALAPALPSDVSSWGRNVEGGLTTQRVQDAVLLVRSYVHLLSNQGAAEVHLICDPMHQWEDQVLLACVRARSLPVRLYRSPWLPRAIRAWTERLRPWAVGVYYLGMLARAGSFRLRRPPPSLLLDGAVIFQSNSSLSKHVENIRPLMHALVACGQRAVALCWEASERRVAAPASAVLASQKLEVIRLEDFLTAGDLWSSLTTTARAALRARKPPASWRRLQTGGVDLYPLLKSSFSHFFVAELPQRLRYNRALAAVLPPAHPVGLKLAGGPESFEGKAALRLLATRTDTLVFHYWVGTAPEWPYADGQKKIDFFLAKGPREVALAAHDYALPLAEIAIAGQGRFGRVRSGEGPTPADSRKLLGLPSEARRYVGFDPNGALRGYLSRREQTEMMATVLEFASRHPAVVVVVKPHPSYPIEHLEPMLKTAALPNVRVLHRRAPFAHFLNAVDLAITKYSTLILEAALAGRVAVSALFDGEERFKIYGDLPVVVRSPHELGELLEMIAGDDRAFDHWRDQVLVHQADRLKDFYTSSVEDPAATAAALLVSRLTLKQSLRGAREDMNQNR